MKKIGIQARVLLLAVAFTLLSAGVMLAESARSVSEQLRRSTLQSTEYAVQTAAEGIRQDILEIDALPNWCALNYTARTALFTDLSTGTLAYSAYPVISNRYYAMRTALYIQRFLILTSNGRVIMMGTAINQSKAVNGENAARLPGMGAGDGPAQWDRLAEDPLTQPGFTVTGIPVVHSFSSSGATARIYLSVSPALITDKLKKLSVEEGEWMCWVMGGQLYRVDGDTLVCLGEVSQLPEPEAVTGDTLDAGTLLYSAVLEGADCQLVMCPLGLHGLYLGRAIPVRGLDYPARLLLSPVLTGLLLVIVMGLVMALLLHRVVGTPIAALQKRMEAVGGGDFTADPEIEWDHELGDVGRGINRLSQNVAELMSKRLEDEKQRQELEYRMLQNQISPHFIYNTLNSIKWMATIQHAPGVAEMVTALSRLMKSVSKGTQKLVPLPEEFALLEDYFTIQRYRYGGTVALEAAPLPGWAEEYRIPRFTLQPLAENAIFHGIEPKGGVGKLTVTVDRGGPGEDLVLSLTDDGVGMAREQIDKVLSGDPEENGPPHFRHVGVWNVHRLLQLSFGPAHGLEIESAPGEGTTVTMRLPRAERETL